MNSFEELNLPVDLSHCLGKIGFEKPTEIQSKAIPVLMQKKDLIVCAETGSGKTGAFLIPMLKELYENPEQQGLILAPTRELVQQIHEFLKTLIANEREFHTTRLVGGMDIRKQFKSLQKKPRIIVATPGRLIDHLKRNTLQIHKVNHLVLDEGDRMIDMGFAPQLNQILKYLGDTKRQTSFFTATIDNKVKELSKKYLKKPVSIAVNSSRPVSKIKQTVIEVEFKDKDECILHELTQREGSIIVFLKTKHRTDRLTKYLSEYGLNVEALHGGRTQGQRNRAIKDFKAGKTRILCATDVAARGIDVPNVEHVINFDLPMQDEDYVHRVGRTARNGAEGEAISMVTPDEHSEWNRLVKKYDIPNSMLEENGRKSKNKLSVRRSGKRGGGDSKNFRGKKKSSFGGSRGKKSADSSDRRGKKKSASSGSWEKMKEESDRGRGKKKTSSSGSGRSKKKSTSSGSWAKKKEESGSSRGKKKSFSKKRNSNSKARTGKKSGPRIKSSARR